MSVLRMVRALHVFKMVMGKELRGIARDCSQLSTDREFSIISLPAREGELRLQGQVSRACRRVEAEPKALCGQRLTMRSSFCATKSLVEVAKSLGLDLVVFLKKFTSLGLLPEKLCLVGVPRVREWGQSQRLECHAFCSASGHGT